MWRWISDGSGQSSSTKRKENGRRCDRSYSERDHEGMIYYKVIQLSKCVTVSLNDVERVILKLGMVRVESSIYLLETQLVSDNSTFSMQ